jgi:hypothetical protein
LEFGEDNIVLAIDKFAAPTDVEVESKDVRVGLRFGCKKDNLPRARRTGGKFFSI